MDNAASEFIFIKEFFFPEHIVEPRSAKEKEAAKNKIARQKKKQQDILTLINEIINTIFEPTTKNITVTIITY